MKQIFLIYHQTIASTLYKNTIILRVSNAFSGFFKLLSCFKKQQNNTPRIRKSNLKLQRHFFALSPQKDKKKERKRPVYENQTWENVHTVCILHTEISENN